MLRDISQLTGATPDGSGASPSVRTCAKVFPKMTSGILIKGNTSWLYCYNSININKNVKFLNCALVQPELLLFVIVESYLRTLEPLCDVCLGFSSGHSIPPSLIQATIQCLQQDLSNETCQFFGLKICVFLSKKTLQGFQTHENGGTFLFRNWGLGLSKSSCLSASEGNEGFKLYTIKLRLVWGFVTWDVSKYTRLKHVSKGNSMSDSLEDHLHKKRMQGLEIWIWMTTPSLQEVWKSQVVLLESIF